MGGVSDRGCNGAVGPNRRSDPRSCLPRVNDLHDQMTHPRLAVAAQDVALHVGQIDAVARAAGPAWSGRHQPTPNFSRTCATE